MASLWKLTSRAVTAISSKEGSMIIDEAPDCKCVCHKLGRISHCEHCQKPPVSESKKAAGTTRTAILKGYELTIVYTDGSRNREYYEPDELGTLDDKWSSLMMSELDGVQTFTLIKDWSKPGETVALKVKQQGD
jgi:hypothetical protein